VLEGRAGSGKTSSAAAARWLTMGPEWPPTQSAAFADTPLAIELAVNREADMPVLIDDLALQLDASESEKREANKKLEHIIRPAGNNTSMRRRGTRDLLEAQSNRVRGVCILTAENLPPAIGESLLRRCLVVTIARGDVDTDAMRNCTPELWPAVSTLGRRIVARLGELGREDAGAQLRRPMIVGQRRSARRSTTATLRPTVRRLTSHGGRRQCLPGSSSPPWPSGSSPSTTPGEWWAPSPTIWPPG